MATSSTRATARVLVRGLPELFSVAAPLKWAVGGWSFFIAENYVLSENRTSLISVLGDNGYHVAYGTLSTAAVTTAFYGYIYKVRGAEPLFWALNGPAPLPARVLSFVCLSMGLGMISQIPPSLQIPVHFVAGDGNDGDSGPMNASSPTTDAPTPSDGKAKAGWAVRCPFDFVDKRAADDGPVHGLERITRHPGLWSFGLLGLGQGLLVPSLPQRLWLAMPSMVALVGGAHTDSRYRRGMGGTLLEEHDRATSNVPFVAMLSGGQGDVGKALRAFSGEMKPLNALIAAGMSGIWVLSRGRGVKIPLTIARPRASNLLS